MDGDAHPDRAGIERERTEGDTGQDGADGLWKRLSEVNHAVGDRGDKDRVDAQARLQPVNQKAAVEEFQREELRGVHQLPGEEVEEAAIGGLVEGVGALEAGVE